jgi:hypothetical protein
MTASGSTPESVPGPPDMFTGQVWMDRLAVGGDDAHKVHLL